jgi:hypothetical protein
MAATSAPGAAQEVDLAIISPPVPAPLHLTAPDPRLRLGSRPTGALPENDAESDPIRARRNDAMVNGGLIALGALGIIDNVVVHWILGWHRAIEDHPHNLQIEVGIVAASAAMLTAGVWRERRARAEARSERSGSD